MRRAASAGGPVAEALTRWLAGAPRRRCGRPRLDRALSLDMFVQDAVHELHLEAATQHLDLRDERQCRIEFRKKVFLDVDEEEDHRAVRMFMACQVRGAGMLGRPPPLAAARD